MTLVEIYMVAGFLLAAYAVVSNDSIQTLGTFLASNSHRPWWVLSLFSSSILVAVLVYGWISNGGDPAYGRLEKFPMPDGGVQFIHVMAPLVLLVLTQFGVPVSTTFLVLTVFAPKNIESMLTKSAIGYVVAFLVALLLYSLVLGKLSEHFHDTKDQEPTATLVALQWASTGFLWAQWLIQDLANIFVFLPRQVELWQLLLAIFALVVMQAIMFFRMGGAIQKIVLSKTGTTDIRAATIVDLIFGVILLVFKEWNNMPMSTTWVFLGLLAGREIAMSRLLGEKTLQETWRLIFTDAGKAFLGLVVSVALAYLAVTFG